MEYTRFERHFDPSTQNVELIEHDLFGTAAVPEGIEGQNEAAGYRAELIQNLPDLRNDKLDDESQDKLFRKGFRAVEQARQRTSNGTPEPKTLNDISGRVHEAFETAGAPGKYKVETYSLVGTPLHEVLGFTGVLKFSEKGKGVYVPFEHLTDPKRAKEFAPVLIPSLPDRSLEPEKYGTAIGQAAHRIFLEIRRRRQNITMRKRITRF